MYFLSTRNAKFHYCNIWSFLASECTLSPRTGYLIIYKQICGTKEYNLLPEYIWAIFSFKRKADAHSFENIP